MQHVVPDTGRGRDTCVQTGVEAGTRWLRDGAVGRVQQGAVLLRVQLIVVLVADE